MARTSIVCLTGGTNRDSGVGCGGGQGAGNVLCWWPI